MILHGAYLDSEIAHEDERFELMHKIFQRTHEEEAAVAKVLATSFLAATGLPAYLYSIGRPAKRLGPALWPAICSPTASINVRFSSLSPTS